MGHGQLALLVLHDLQALVEGVGQVGDPFPDQLHLVYKETVHF